MDVLVLIGRILFVPLFLASAVGHLTQTEAMAGYAKSRGVPVARIAVLVTGVMLVVGGILVLLGLWADLGALILFVFLVPTAVLMHGFWRDTDPQARQNEMVQFQKDIALAGACLMLFAFFAYVGDDLGLTLTGPLFDLN
jgi:putative oxidoreductase